MFSLDQMRWRAHIVALWRILLTIWNWPTICFSFGGITATEVACVRIPCGTDRTAEHRTCDVDEQPGTCCIIDVARLAPHQVAACYLPCMPPSLPLRLT